MQEYQKTFIRLAIEHKVLCFGEYTLKSGRKSPYFFNAGRFQTGSSLATLGSIYAQALMTSSLSIDMLFGPAYKGIPLVTATAIALAKEYQLDLPIGYNRKEAKDHGEGGVLAGAPLQGKVAIIDDVITAGTAVREVIEMIESAGAEPAAVIIGLDRQEIGSGGRSTIQEIEQTYKIPVHSIIKLDDIIHYMQANQQHHQLEAITAYRNNYGV